MSDLRSFDQSYNTPVCGIDEVGRGPLAGPVTAACVFIPDIAIKDAPELLTMMDSKKLSLKKREQLCKLIKMHCVWGVGEASVAEIDQINILQATYLAMQRAAHAFCNAAPILRDKCTALIDGNRIPPDLPFKFKESIIKGDNKSLSIAAASILAKTIRDNYMGLIANDYPQYGWESNAGYGSVQHKDAINTYGATPHHRMSFAPLKDLKRG